MSEKLKPCPFCGGEPMYDETYGIGSVFCTKCGAESPAGFTGNGKKENAIKQWNTRVASWIKTSERLPKPFERVLGVFEYADEMFVTSGKYRDIDRSFVTDYEEEFWIKDVPYWMPLPELPEVEE